MAKFPTSGKQKPNFATGSTITTANIEHSEKVTVKFLTVVSMATVELMIESLCFLNNVKHINSWKKENPSGNTELKPFTQ